MVDIPGFRCANTTPELDETKAVWVVDVECDMSDWTRKPSAGLTAHVAPTQTAPECPDVKNYKQQLNPSGTVVGTCESFFFVRIESRTSRIESAVRFVFESNLRIESAVYHTSRNTAWRPSGFCICDDDVWTTELWTGWVLVSFNSVIKRAKQCCCTLILLPKSTLNANLTTIDRFFTNDDWQRGRFEKFLIGPSIRIESRIGRAIRNRIESRSFAGPYLISTFICVLKYLNRLLMRLIASLRLFQTVSAFRFSFISECADVWNKAEIKQSAEMKQFFRMCHVL